ncbi:MAG: hypothetical protein VXZ72_02390 [Chlamydiota bacterium]|nr:hypothetical protein [Chlamydiota bacterium]
MSTPKSVTIQLNHVHPSLKGAILGAKSRSAEVVRLLNELVQFRLDQASTDALAEEIADQENQEALRTQLCVADGTIGGLRAAVAKRDRQIEALQKSLHTKKEDLAMKIKAFRNQDEKDKKALTHALALIHYLNPRRFNDQ